MQFSNTTTKKQYAAVRLTLRVTGRFRLKSFLYLWSSVGGYSSVFFYWYFLSPLGYNSVLVVQVYQPETVLNFLSVSLYCDVVAYNAGGIRLHEVGFNLHLLSEYLSSPQKNALVVLIRVSFQLLIDNVSSQRTVYLCYLSPLKFSISYAISIALVVSCTLASSVLLVLYWYSVYFVVLLVFLFLAFLLHYSCFY